MQKKYLFSKKLNKLVISITYRIESFFNFFKEIFSNKKNLRSIKTIDKKIFVSIATILVVIMSYFLIPAFYDEKKIKSQLENQIFERYNIKVELNESFSYGLFPTPHFAFKDIILKHEVNEIAKSNNFKIFISAKNFFSPERLNFKNLIFNKTDFKIKSSDFSFFIDLLNLNKKSQNLKFLNSNFFYLDQNDDIIFIVNSKKLDYFYKDDLLEKLSSKLNVFNIPISLDVDHNINESNFFTEIKSFPLRLNIKSNSNYKNNKFEGDIDLTLINENIKIYYELENNILKFKTKDKEINGNVNIKPFFISINFDLFYFDIDKIFEKNSILINILKSETLNNKNLNGNISVNTNNFKNLNFINELKFDILLEEGEIFVKNLITIFKEAVIINIDETQLIVDDNKLKFAGYVNLDFINIKKFFEHYQITIKDRKYIKKIKFAFLYHFDDNFIEIDNLNVDSKTNPKLEKFLNDFNSKKDNIYNKILLRNSIKKFFKIINLD